MYSLRLFRPHDSAWKEYLTLVAHDFFHTAAYHALSESYEGGEAWLAVYGNDQRFLAWPYLLQEIQGLDSCTAGLRDITSAYGSTGPLAHNCVDDEDFLACAWAILTELWRSQRAISIFTRLHSMCVSEKLIHALWKWSNAQGVEGGVYLRGHTVTIDLTQSSAEIWNGIGRKMRRDLRHCQRAGLTSAPDPSWADLDDFVRLYYHTMDRNRAAAFYFFPREYLLRLQRALGPHGSLIITRHGNDVAAVGLFIEYQRIVSLHLLASGERFSFMSPSKLTIHDAAVWAKSRGNRLLVLGGGRGGNDDDSLFRFKSRFSNTCQPFYTGRWILDRNAYDSVVKECRKRAHRSWSEEALSDYFPLYRATFTGHRDHGDVPRAEQQCGTQTNEDNLRID